MNHIMLDVETLDTASTAVVLSIGAVQFDPYCKRTGDQFYGRIDNEVDQTNPRNGQPGRTISPNTVAWWMKQNKAAQRAAFATFRKSTNLDRILSNFEDFVNHIRDDGKGVHIWGNGANFDNAVVRSLYDYYGIYECPWTYKEDRCYRTMKAMFGQNIPVQRQGTEHNALDDAITQAKHLQEIFAACRTIP